MRANEGDRAGTCRSYCTEDNLNDSSQMGVKTFCLQEYCADYHDRLSLGIGEHQIPFLKQQRSCKVILERSTLSS